MKTYVIFREDGIDPTKEIFVDMASRANAILVGATEDRNDALEFVSAREAYEWAGRRKLDWWRVGAR